MIRTLLTPAVAAAALAVAGAAQAGYPDLFYNYYVGPSTYGGGIPAQMYISPRPTPAYVGHHWVTYPPMMPNEFLYCHKRTYYKYYPTGGYSTAHVKYW